MHNDNDQLAFLDDMPEPDPGREAEACWFLLIVYDVVFIAIAFMVFDFVVEE